MIPRPPKRVGVGVAGDARHVFIRSDHESVVGRVYFGFGALHAGKGEQFARELRHEYHHGGVRGEPLGAELFPERRRFRGAVGVP